MANSLEELQNIPDISILEDSGLTLEDLQQEMIEDYQDAYEEITGEQITLYPANEIRLLIQVLAGQLYQAYEYGEYMHQQNFIKYMDDDHLENWGANLGFIDDEESAASVMLEFGLDEALTYDVEIPEGTEVTAGDDVFFATDKTVVISAGETSISVSATCTETGTAGNGYSLGQISEISDSLPYVSYVKNTSISDFGKEKSTGDDLREKIFLYPSTYSTAGPEDEYIYYVKQYSESIVDVNIEADAEATVNIWVMLQNGQLPNEEYCALVKNFIEELKCTPDTDKINVRIPEASEYELSLTYYISKSSRDNESEIKEKVEDAIQSYIEYQYSGLGIDINPDVLIEKIRAAGAKRVEMTTPTYKKLEKGQVAICTEKNILYGGLEED